MTITQLTYVLALAEHRNFTLAAEKCFVTQPTLSMQIQKLEEELHVSLFDRSKKPIGITEVGQKVVAQAKNIVSEANRMKDIVDQEKGYIGGEYVLGIIPTVMPTLLPLFLAHFMRKYPQVQLVIKEQTTTSLVENLKEGNLDGAIAATPLELDYIEERPLYYEPFVGYVPESHRLHSNKMLLPQDLQLDDVLLLQDGHCFREGVINLCRHQGAKETTSFQLESGSFETLTNLANEGLGMTLLPYLHTLELKEEEKANLIHFEAPAPAREISLIYHTNELKIQITNALKDAIQAAVKSAIIFQEVEIISPKAKN